MKSHTTSDVDMKIKNKKFSLFRSHQQTSVFCSSFSSAEDYHLFCLAPAKKIKYSESITLFK